MPFQRLSSYVCLYVPLCLRLCVYDCPTVPAAVSVGVSQSMLVMYGPFVHVNLCSYVSLSTHLFQCLRMLMYTSLSV